MPTRLTQYPVRGLLRWVLRLPIWLYRARLGWLLGDRFLMLNHIGHKSGLRHNVVLEVVRHDRATGVYIIASGWGEKSDWFRNIQKTPPVVVYIGRRGFDATATRLPYEASVRELRDYARRHPAAFRELSRLMSGQRLNGTEGECRILAQHIPLVSLLPTLQARLRSI